MAQLKSPRKDQRRHSMELGETAVAVVVPAVGEPVIESTIGTDEIAEEADPKIAVAQQIKSLPLSQQVVPYQHPSS